MRTLKKSKVSSASMNYMQKKQKNLAQVINMSEIYESSSQYSKTIISIKNHAKKDFVKKNKSNLKNFFKDRLPNNNLQFYESKQECSPAKIYQYRRKQLQKQAKTNFSMNNSFEIEKTNSNKQIKKIKQCFYVNDKSRQLRLKYRKSNEGLLLNTTSYKFGTESSIRKVSKVLKKEAYESVFGKDESEFVEAKRKPSKIIFKKLAKSRYKSEMKKEEIKKEDRNKFKVLIGRIAEYNKELNQEENPIAEQEKDKQLFDILKSENSEEKTGFQDNILNWVKELSSKYKFQFSKQDRISCLNDIKKIDPKFFSAIMEHKKNRLKVRQFGIYGQFSRQNSLENEEQDDRNQFQYEQSENSEQNNQESILITSTARFKDKNKKIFEEKSSTYTIRERLQRFGLNLAHALQTAKMFGIQQQNIFKVLWQNKTPFQLQGSYALFKAIKNDEHLIFKNFIERDQNYLYQVDSEYRSVLIYAVVHERVQMVKYILSKGVNIEHKCKKNKTALYYSLLLNNHKISQLLLQKGANPWSTESCQFSIKLYSEQCLNLLKNARKVSIAFKITPHVVKKFDFWEKNKGKILPDKLLSFNQND